MNLLFIHDDVEISGEQEEHLYSGKLITADWLDEQFGPGNWTWQKDVIIG